MHHLQVIILYIGQNIPYSKPLSSAYGFPIKSFWNDNLEFSPTGDGVAKRSLRENPDLKEDELLDPQLKPGKKLLKHSCPLARQAAAKSYYFIPRFYINGIY